MTIQYHFQKLCKMCFRNLKCWRVNETTSRLCCEISDKSRRQLIIKPSGGATKVKKTFLFFEFIYGPNCFLKSKNNKNFSRSKAMCVSGNLGVLRIA